MESGTISWHCLHSLLFDFASVRSISVGRPVFSEFKVSDSLLYCNPLKLLPFSSLPPPPPRPIYCVENLRLLINFPIPDALSYRPRLRICGIWGFLVFDSFLRLRAAIRVWNFGTNQRALLVLRLVCGIGVCNRKGLNFR